MLGLDILLQIKNAVKMVNVNGYIGKCPLAWCHWTIFFRSLCFVNCSMLTCTVIDAIERLKQEDLKVKVSCYSECFSSIFGTAYRQVFLEDHLLT